jgi:hypothetical protein
VDCNARKPSAAERPPTAEEIDAARARQRAERQRAVASAGDEVDISPIGHALSRIHELPDVRADKVAAVREAIERDSYEDPQKLDVAISRLLQDLALEPTSTN